MGSNTINPKLPSYNVPTYPADGQDNGQQVSTRLLNIGGMLIDPRTGMQIDPATGMPTSDYFQNGSTGTTGTTGTTSWQNADPTALDPFAGSNDAPPADPFANDPAMNKTSSDGSSGSTDSSKTPWQPSQPALDPADDEFLKQCKALQTGIKDNPMVYGRYPGMMQPGGMAFIGGKVNKDQLEAISKNENLSSGVRDAAKYFMKPENAERFKQLETGRGETSADGTVSLDDLDSQIKFLEGKQRTNSLTNNPKTQEMKDSLATMKEYSHDFDGAGDGGDIDGKISDKDFQAIIESDSKGEGKYSSEVVKAAKFFHENPDLFKMVDTAKDGGDADGIASMDDVNAMISLMPKETSTPSTSTPTSSQFTDAQRAYLQTLKDPNARAYFEQIFLQQNGGGQQQPMTASQFPQIIR